MTDSQFNECKKIVDWYAGNQNNFNNGTAMGQVFPICLTAVAPQEVHPITVGRIIQSISGDKFTLN